MNLLTPSMYLAAALLVSVCLAIPTAQWALIPTQWWGQLFAGAAALAIGICKLGFFPLALNHFSNNHRFIGSCFLITGMLFLVISINATFSLLNNEVLNRAANQNQQSLGFKNQQHQLTDLNQEITTLNHLMASDAQGGYRGRALKQTQHLQQLKQQRQQLIKAINQQATNTHASEFLQASGMNSAMIVAISLHLACVLAVLACGQWHPSSQKPKTTKPKPKPKPKPKSQATKKSIKQTASDAAPLNAQTSLNTEQMNLAKAIKSGEYGNTPGLKKIIQLNVIKGGNPKVKPVFDWLEENHIIRKNGQTFELIQTTI